MKNVFGLLLFAAFGGLAFNGYGAEGDTTASMTITASDTKGCGQEAKARVSGTFTANTALQEIGVGSITINNTAYSYNRDLTANPPHSGVGNGSASVTQSVICFITKLASGEYSQPSVSITTTTITRPCEHGE